MEHLLHRNEDMRLASREEARARDETIQTIALYRVIKDYYPVEDDIENQNVSDVFEYDHSWIVNVHTKQKDQPMQTHVVAVDKRTYTTVILDVTSPEAGQFALQEEGGLQRG